MSVRRRHAVRGRPRLRRAAPTLLILCLLTLGGASLASARPPVPVAHVAPSQAKTAGVAIGIGRQHVKGGDVVAVTLPAAGSSSATTPVQQAARLLALAPDGTAAIVQSLAAPSPDLVLAHPDGSQDRVGLPGILGAAVAPSGWLAAVDSAGILWRIDALSGRVESLATGPFGSSIAFTHDGALLLIEVSSVEAPYASRLVRFDPDARQGHAILDDPGFVFSASELVAGDTAAVIHPFGGGVAVVRASGGAAIPLGDLPAQAIEATVDAAGRTAVFALADDGIYLQDLGSGARDSLGDGGLPRIARDGSSILVLRGSRTLLLGRDGSTLAAFSSPTVGWAGCAGRCLP
jgi:hypothetical protein